MRDGRFLLTSRPAGKVYAGYWEFPGGKLEAGERSSRRCGASCTRNSASRSARRTPWQIELVDYPHARVRLHFCKVFEWHGEFQMREGQAMAWQTLPVRSRAGAAGHGAGAAVVRRRTEAATAPRTAD